MSLKRELKNTLRLDFSPYPTRIVDTARTRKELERELRASAKASHEPEGARIRSSLWSDPDVPRSSLPPLLALEAARLQGRDAHHELLQRLSRLAHEEGVNVTRSDVLFEVAGTLSLDMDKFTAAFESEHTRRLILNGQRLSHERGVRSVPALVIDERWMLTGLRGAREYRVQLRNVR
jgi:predicted DsbA family dithiol-disulfide isomerase